MAQKVKVARMVGRMRAGIGCSPSPLRGGVWRIRDRAIKLLDVIEAETGKQVTGRDSEETIKAFGVPLVRAASGRGTGTRLARTQGVPMTEC